jgi:hypothetical protein
MVSIDVLEKKKSKKHSRLIENSIKDMTREFDKYIKEVKQVPWWYNEKSLLGFYMGGLIRKTDAVILQEISCSKGKKGDKKGRADLWFKYLGKEYITEAKLCYTSLNTDTNFEDATKWAQAVLDQANKYRKDLEVKKDNVFSLCFEVIYCKQENLENFSDVIEKDWLCDKSPNKLHFCYLILLNKHLLKKKKYFQDRDSDNNVYYYPAVMVYGLFN